MNAARPLPRGRAGRRAHVARPVALRRDAGRLAGAAGAAAAQARAPLESQASGLFINAAGQVLTAAHAVTGCASLYALKDGQVRRATVVARDDARDLALLDTGFKPYLSATFAATPEGSGGRPVFTEGLWRIAARARASTVFNGMTAPHGGGSATELLLFSPVKPGASGSPVLGGAGLVLGMVVERVAVDGRLSGTVALSRRGGSAPGRAPRGSRRCRWTASPVSCASRARSMRSATGLSWAPCRRRRRARDAVGRHYLRMRGERCEPPCPPFERE